MIIHTELNIDEAYRTIGRLFVSKGLTIDDASRDFGTITASGLYVESLSDAGWELTVSALLSGDDHASIELIGFNKCIQQNENRRTERVRVAAMGAIGRSWDLFLEMANGFEGATIEFKKR